MWLIYCTMYANIAGKESLANKEHRTSPCIMKTKVDQANEISVSRFDTCLNTRYVKNVSFSKNELINFFP